MKKENSNIITILNKYKNTFDDFIDSLDIKFLDQLGPINKRLHNISSFEDSLIGLLKEDCLNKNVLDMPLKLVLQSQNFQIHQYYNIAIFGLKNERVQYRKSQKDKKDKKGKRVEKDRKDERDEKGH